MKQKEHDEALLFMITDYNAHLYLYASRLQFISNAVSPLSAAS